MTMESGQRFIYMYIFDRKSNYMYMYLCVFFVLLYFAVHVSRAI
jgi:hypothetical protein